MNTINEINGAQVALTRIKSPSISIEVAIAPLPTMNCGQPV